MESSSRHRYELRLEGPRGVSFAFPRWVRWLLPALIVLALLVLLTWPRVLAYTPVFPAVEGKPGEAVLALARIRSWLPARSTGVRVLWEIEREGLPEPLFTGESAALSPVRGEWQAAIRLPEGVRPMDRVRWRWQGRVLGWVPGWPSGRQEMVLGPSGGAEPVPAVPRALEPLTGDERAGDVRNVAWWRDPMGVGSPVGADRTKEARVRFLWSAAPPPVSGTFDNPSFFRGWRADPGAGLGNDSYFILRIARWEGDPDAPELQPWTVSPDRPDLGVHVYRYVPAPGPETDRVSFEASLDPGRQYVWSVARVVNGVASGFSSPFEEGTGAFGEAFTTRHP